MAKVFQRESVVVENRFLFANIAVFTIICVLLVRLWYIQVYKGDHYLKISQNNRIRLIQIPASRGMVFDRHGKVVLANRPFFDLIYIPQYVKDKDTTFKILSRIMHVPASKFERRLRQVRGQPKYLPVSLKRNLSMHEVATIESNKAFLPGIDIGIAPRRDHRPDTPPHMIGYMGEINRKSLKKLNGEFPDNPYHPGDLVGKQGLELRWEKYLRGKKGQRLIQVDAFGRKTNSLDFDNIKLPHIPATPGSDLILTLDMDLQRVTKKAFKGKYGAVVAIRPQNGEILALVSEPGFDPSIFQGILSIEKYRSLASNPFKPFLDKTTGGVYPPGSPFKAVVAAGALEEKVVTPRTTYHCPGYYEVGDKVIYCHKRAGHGTVNLRQALLHSCDVYFYNVGVELGVDRIAKYAKAFGLGKKLGLKLNYEMPGLVPTSAWKKLIYRIPWTAGDTPNVAIGQGANLMTPLQMANLFATFANNGKIWRPFLVKSAINHIGEKIFTQSPELISDVDIVSAETFRIVNNGLKAVVMSEEGTGRRARVEGVSVAGKTGSVQVVSLTKNISEFDVSMKWREHAMFAAFSPVKKAEIAVAVISEHDTVGGGGKAAAPIAQKIIKAYWDLKRKRKSLSVITPKPEPTNGEEQSKPQ